LGYARAAEEQLETTLKLEPGMAVARDLLEKLKTMTSAGNQPTPK
jgi:hypothetical protein